MNLNLLDSLIELGLLLVGSIITFVFNESKSQIVKLTNSVNELNVNVAKIVEQISYQNKRIERLEDIIDK